MKKKTMNNTLISYKDNDKTLALYDEYKDLITKEINKYYCKFFSYNDFYGLEYADYKALGVLAFLLAKKNYNPKKGPFLPYLKLWINSILLDQCKSLIKLPIQNKNAQFKILKFDFADQKEDDSIYNEYDEVVNYMEKYSYKNFNYVLELKKQFLLMAIEALPERDKFIIKSYFGIDGPRKTYEEIAKKLNLTRERIHQKVHVLLHLLRKKIGEMYVQ